jgi:uncharacterized protein YbcV (DUF1398 family)
MFTLEQIEKAHEKVYTGADFPTYIKYIKSIGVNRFETYVEDSRTEYYGLNDYSQKSYAKYAILQISDICDKSSFLLQLKKHQDGETDYFTFCRDCAYTGIQKWIVNLDDMTCTYFDRNNNVIVVEQLPI